MLYYDIIFFVTVPAVSFVLQRLQFADVRVELFLATKYVLTSLVMLLHS